MLFELSHGTCFRNFNKRVTYGVVPRPACQKPYTFSALNQHCVFEFFENTSLFLFAGGRCAQSDGVLRFFEKLILCFLQKHVAFRMLISGAPQKHMAFLSFTQHAFCGTCWKHGCFAMVCGTTPQKRRVYACFTKSDFRKQLKTLRILHPQGAHMQKRRVLLNYVT